MFIGNGGAEFGVRGYISAYDAETGAMAWRFYTVPGRPGEPDGAASDKALAEKAAPTWNGEYWTIGGGGTVWDAIVYDPELDLLYFGIGNGSPWTQGYRGKIGDNLFLASIVAVKPDTGEYVWHYQEVPGDEWDFTSVQPMMLADLPINGETRKVLMHAPKNGFFYVIDRTNGQIISAEPFAPVTWATSIDKETGRPVENPEARYSRTGKPWRGTPGPQGAHNWNPMAFSPMTGFVYIPVSVLTSTYVQADTFGPRVMGFNTGIDRSANGAERSRGRASGNGRLQGTPARLGPGELRKKHGGSNIPDPATAAFWRRPEISSCKARLAATSSSTTRTTARSCGPCRCRRQ